MKQWILTAICCVMLNLIVILNPIVSMDKKQRKNKEVDIKDKEIMATTTVKASISEYDYIGIASFYDYRLKNGWSSIGHNVAAMRDVKRYRKVLVENLENHKKVVVKITDYGPDASVFPERIIDLSSSAFASLTELKRGIIKVGIKIIE